MVWAQCQGEQHIGRISGRLYRLVESQEQIATLGYVDTLEEQALLEEMLDAVKPPYPANTANLHYLLKTPFRYPPLKWGSRFGRVHEPGIFYGGGSVETTLAESAYYRFVFWHSMQAKPVKDKIRSEHTMFSVSYQSNKGIRLQNEPFRRFVSVLAHPQNYMQSQLCGSAMREAGVEIFEYQSARDRQHGICIGMFTPAAFRTDRPDEKSQWLCESSGHEVVFKQLGNAGVNRFVLENFLLEGQFPMLA